MLKRCLIVIAIATASVSAGGDCEGEFTEKIKFNSSPTNELTYLIQTPVKTLSP